MQALHSYLIAVALGMGMAVASFAWAQQPGGPPRGTPVEKSQQQAQKEQKQQEGKTVVVDKTYRVETLKGMKVKNPEGEDLGKIQDLVIDMESHKLRYAALSHGGFLGIGDKLFAVPIESLRLKHDGEDSYFVVDVDKETLKTAPGFAKDAWPDFANPTWMASMDKHYGSYKTLEGKVESAINGNLKLTDDSGKEHTFNIGPNVQVFSSGEKAELKDLSKGQQVKVTTTERDGKRVVTSIQGKQAERTARQPTDRTSEPQRN
jgi:sporulation protein YlmC with PRC-barrel domain